MSIRHDSAMSADDRLERAGEMYRRAVYSGDGSGLADAERGQPVVRLAMACANADTIVASFHNFSRSLIMCCNSEARRICAIANATAAVAGQYDQPWSIIESGNSSETRMEAHVAITRIDGESARNQRGGDANQSATGQKLRRRHFGDGNLPGTGVLQNLLHAMVTSC